MIALSVVVFVNYLANAIPLNGQTTGEISNRLLVIITPASYIFIIWGFIYFMLFLWFFRQLPKVRRNLLIYKQSFRLFLLSCILNVLWLFSWHNEKFILSVIIMISLLLTLISLYYITKKSAQTFIDAAPFSIYLGWISIATIVNISYVLVYLEWGRFGLSDVLWTVIMLIVATFLSVVFRIRNHDPLFPLVLWAFIGIGIKNVENFPIVTYVAFVLVGLILLMIIFGNHKRVEFRFFIIG